MREGTMSSHRKRERAGTILESRDFERVRRKQQHHRDAQTHTHSLTSTNSSWRRERGIVEEWASSPVCNVDLWAEEEERKKKREPCIFWSAFGKIHEWIKNIYLYIFRVMESTRTHCRYRDSWASKWWGKFRILSGVMRRDFFRCYWWWYDDHRALGRWMDKTKA